MEPVWTAARPGTPTARHSEKAGRGRQKTPRRTCTLMKSSMQQGDQTLNTDAPDGQPPTHMGQHLTEWTGRQLHSAPLAGLDRTRGWKTIEGMDATTRETSEARRTDATKVRPQTKPQQTSQHLLRSQHEEGRSQERKET